MTPLPKRATPTKLQTALLSFTTAPWLSLAMFALALATGPLAALSTKCIANVIDAAIAEDSRAALASLGLAALTAFLTSMTALGAVAVRKLTTRLLERHVKTELLTTAAKVDYLTFISSEHQDAFELSDYDITETITNMQECVMALVTTGINMASYIILLGTMSGVIAIACCAVIVAVTMFTANQSGKDQRQIRAETADYVRSLYMLDAYYSHSNFASEMALFGNRPYVDRLYSDIAVKLNDARAGANVRRAKRGIVYSLFNGVIVASALIGTALAGGITTAGDITIAVGAMLAVLAGGSAIGETFAEMINATETVRTFSDYVGAFSREKLLPEDGVDPNAPAVEIKDLRYSFGELDVLKGVDITIPRGETVAIVGENGAGKTTLVNLILGLYRSQSGTVRVFGADPFEHRDDETFPVSAVFQQYAKYPGLTVLENITLGRDIDRKTLSSIDAFFDTLDFDKVVGMAYEEGGEFSGGEWQKMVIARCANAQSDLVLLDEPTAALDPMAEMRVFNNAIEVFGGKTCIFVTHRLGAARRADRIIVLKDGVVAECGTHDQLMAQDGYYAAMFRAQSQWYSREVGA